MCNNKAGIDDDRPRWPSLPNFIKAVKFTIFLSSMLAIIIMIPSGFRILVIGFMIIFIVPLLLSFVSGSKDWEIKNERLYIVGLTPNNGLSIPDMSIGIVGIDSQWEPIESFNKIYYFPRNRVQGRCRLKNNKCAFVFSDMAYGKYLVVFANDTYYMFAHPCIGSIYTELLNSGAVAKNFEESKSAEM